MTNVVLNAGSGGATVGTDTVTGVDYQIVKVGFSATGVAPVQTSAANPLPVVQTGTPALPTGAATAAKQPALGTAGSASTDVITVQGIASGTAQNVSGTVTANAGSGSFTVAQATAGNLNATVVGSGSFTVAQATAASLNATVVQATAASLNATVLSSGAVASGATDSGNPVKVGGKYNSTPITLTDGQRGDLQLNPAGSLNVNIVSGAGSGGTALADNATFTRGTTSETPAGGVVETSAPTLTTGKAGALSLTTAGGLRIDGSGVTQPVSQATASSLNAAVVGSIASGSADSGNPVKVGGKYNSSPITLTNGQRGDLQLDASGYLEVNIKAGAGSGGTALADNTTFTRGTTSETPIGGVVETSAPTLTAGNAGAMSLTTLGSLRVAVAEGGIPGFNEDAPATSGDGGVQMLAVRQDSLVSSVSTDGDYGSLKFNSVGSLYVANNVLQLAGTTVDTNSGNKSAGTQRVVIATDQPNLTTALNVSDLPVTTGGLSWFSALAPATPAATSIKSSAGQLYALACYNILATPVYLKLYNLATGSVTLGTTSALMEFMIPGNTAGTGFTLNIDKGIAFSTAITFAVTSGISLTDNTSTTASSVIVNAGYK